MKHELFSRKVRRTIFFVLESTYPEDTPYQVWFDLNNFLTRLKKPVFKIPFSRNWKSSVWNTNFFPRQATPKILFVFILITLVILPAEIGLIWTTSWPVKKDLFLKFLFRETEKVPYEILTFFLGKLHQKFFSFSF